MSKKKESYEATTIWGDQIEFASIEEYQKFFRNHPHLFEELPIIPTEQLEPTEEGGITEAGIAEVGYVNPDYYKNRKYETFDVQRDSQGYQRHIGYLEGCVIKYIMRWDKKHDDPLMDLRKAERYLQQLIKTIEEEQQYAMASTEGAK